MYVIALDSYSEFEKGENPEFTCKDFDELIKVMAFFFENGYDVLVKKVD